MKYLIAILGILWLSTSLFIIDARNVAVVTMFGDPVQDIAPPWECIYTFCETALQSSLGRIALPFVCVSSMSDPHAQYYFPLRNFNYQNREWKMSVSSLSNLSVE